MKNKVKFKPIISLICGLILAVGVCCLIHQVSAQATEKTEEIKFADLEFEKAVRQQSNALQEGPITGKN
jgi:hypothetical protein